MAEPITVATEFDRHGGAVVIRITDPDAVDALASVIDEASRLAFGRTDAGWVDLFTALSREGAAFRRLEAFHDD